MSGPRRPAGPAARDSVPVAPAAGAGPPADGPVSGAAPVTCTASDSDFVSDVCNDSEAFAGDGGGADYRGGWTADCGSGDGDGGRGRGAWTGDEIGREHV